ncbi:hypothetical protein H640_05701 [Cutibacterium granulosum TM11]|nr:hypothetical protein H640_05701 [Cutibacterium granulosum TM11]
MELCPALADRFLIADRAKQLCEVLDEARPQVDEIGGLRRVEPMISSVVSYVPTTTWVQALLRDHILFGLQRDFMTQVADRIDPLMQPPESTWAQFFAHAEGRRARLDATLRRILDADTQGTDRHADSQDVTSPVQMDQTDRHEGSSPDSGEDRDDEETLGSGIRAEASVFARRYVGEVLSVAQRLAAVEQDLTVALTGRDQDDDDINAVNEIMADVLHRNDDRLADLGLEP